MPFGQGFGEITPAHDAFETAVLDRTLVHDGGGVSNLALEMDDSGNRKPSKQQAREGIDPAVAGIMAVGLHARTKPEDDTDRPFRGMTSGLFSGRVQPRQRRGERYAAAA